MGNSMNFAAGRFRCGGEYLHSVSERINGQPVWKQRGSHLRTAKKPQCLRVINRQRGWDDWTRFLVRTWSSYWWWGGEYIMQKGRKELSDHKLLRIIFALQEPTDVDKRWQFRAQRRRTRSHFCSIFRFLISDTPSGACSKNPAYGFLTQPMGFSFPDLGPSGFAPVLMAPGWSTDRRWF